MGAGESKVQGFLQLYKELEASPGVDLRPWVHMCLHGRAVQSGIKIALHIPGATVLICSKLPLPSS